MRLNIKIGQVFWSTPTLAKMKVVEETNTTFYLAYFNGSSSEVVYVDKQMTGEEFDKQYTMNYKSALLCHIANKQSEVDFLKSYYNTVKDNE